MSEIEGSAGMRRLGRAGALLMGVALVALPWTPAALAGIPTPPPDPAADDAYEIDEDQALDVAAPGVLANDFVLSEASCAAVTDDSTLAGDVTLAADGSFTFTPTADFNGATSFTYGLMLVGTEGCTGPYHEDEGTVTITVRSVNDRPVAVADTFQFVWNQTLNIAGPGVLSNDSDPDGDPLTAIKATDPVHGVLTLAANGGFSYTPDAAACPGTPDSFSYRASDGSETSPARVVMLQPAALPCPTPFVSPSPAPTPSPSIEASPSLAPSPSGSLEPSPTVDPSDSAPPPTVPSVIASPSPAASGGSGPVAGEGGLSLPVLLVLLLLGALLAFGAAYYVPRWIEAQRTGRPIEDDADEPYDGPYDGR